MANGGSSIEHSVKKLLEAHSFNGRPEDLIRQLNRKLLADIDGSVPVDLSVAASFAQAHVSHGDFVEEGSVRWEADRFQIRISTRVGERRQRFTLAHEINHLFFLRASKETVRTDLKIDGTSRSTKSEWLTEELLCDIGASELLLPLETMQPFCVGEPSIEIAMGAAQAVEASVEAALLRMLDLGGRKAAMVFLERKLKPTEIQMAEADKQGNKLFDLPLSIAPKLRVRYAASFNGFPHIPKDKSVADDCPLSTADEQGADIEFRGLTGLLGRSDRAVQVSARSMPFVDSDGQKRDRVLAVLF